MRHSRAVSIALVGLFAVGSVAWAETDWPSAPVPKTGKATSLLPGDDGDLQKGIKIPSPRYADNGDGTVTDHLTGLVWLKDADCFGTAMLSTALTSANTLDSGECGLSDGSAEGDWRLPNKREMQSLIDFGYSEPAMSNTSGAGQWSEGDPFTQVQAIYWSSTTEMSTQSLAFAVHLSFGEAVVRNKTEPLGVWPVKADTAPTDVGWPPAPLPKTGQWSVFEVGDDGDLQTGVPHPIPRFTDNGDGTVVDNLTGLTWLKDASCDNPTLFWTDAVNWGAALYDGCVDCGATGGDCGLADGSVPGDWRLPNVLELHSLIHHGFFSPALPNTHGGYQWSEGDPFVGVEGNFYWSSTVAVVGANVYPWKVYMAYGDVLMSTVVDAYCWPVKGSLMFADGFGSADTRRWSSVAP